MTPLPVCNARDFARILEKLGFVCTRSRGSHFHYRHPDGRRTTLPYHGGRAYPRPFICDVLMQVRVDQDIYVALLAKL